MADDANIFRFLLTTDNHLGYMEKDPRRGKDSFVSFEECLREAVVRRVDAMLLGGDLFHENKPSLSTLSRAMTLMKRYVMGDASINFTMLSDPKINFPRHPVQLANFQDPNVNIALPIFMIHGNHDDTTSGHSAIDILASSSLVNYFGASDSVDDIVLKPILLQKGTTRVALYGLGSLRDEKLHRAFRYHKVRVVKPKEGEGWFSILLFHQNRGLRSAFSKDGIQEKMLSGFGFDLVIWGNEHEQLMAPQPSEGFDIVQPGSSILTSLSASESNPKQFGILEVKGTAFRVTGFPIQSCRPVVRRTVELWRDCPNGRSITAVEEHLERIANDMLQEAQLYVQRIPAEVLEYHPNIKYPLMRLAVDFHDPDSAIGANYPIPNPNRFGQRFINDVANAGDMLKAINDKHRRRLVQQHIDLDAPQQAMPQNIPVNDIRAKLAAALAANTKDSCQLLSEYELGQAIYAFVEKDDKDSVPAKVKSLLDQSQEHIRKAIRKRRIAEAQQQHNNGAQQQQQQQQLLIEPQAIVDLAFNHKKEVNKHFHEAELEQKRREEGRPSLDAVQEIIARHQQVSSAAAPMEEAGDGCIDEEVVPPAAPLPPSAGKKVPAKRARVSAGGEPRAPAARGRKKEVPAPHSAPALNLNMGGGANDLYMWTK